MPDLRYRDYASADREAVARLLDDAFGAGFWSFQLDGPGAHRVAVARDRIVGFASASLEEAAQVDIPLEPPVCTVHSVAVAEDSRGQGIATRLVDEVCAECAELGARSFLSYAWVYATTGVAPLAGVLERAGFELARREEGFYAGAMAEPCPVCAERSCVCPADVYVRGVR